jgi:hypothetical protein
MSIVTPINDKKVKTVILLNVTTKLKSKTICELPTEIFFFKETIPGSGSMAQVAEHLPSRHKALSSNQKKTKQRTT